MERKTKTMWVVDEEERRIDYKAKAWYSWKGC